MRNHIRRFAGAARAWLSCLAVIAGLISVWNVPAGASIEVRLADGSRVRVDRIGPETNGRHIALRMERDRIVLTRLVPWHRVDSARIGDRDFTRETLQTYFSQKKQENLPLGDGSISQRQLLPIRYENTSVGDPFAVDGEGPQEPALAFRDTASVTAADDCCRPPVRFGFECAPRPVVRRPPCYAPLPVEATVIGVRRDPLAAYRGLLEQYFPDGVPVSEAPFVLEMLRAKKFQEMFAGRQPAAEQQAPPQPAPTYGRAVRPIRNLSVRALPISKHGKVDWDALAVEITALDRFGLPTAVRGTIRATLWGQKQRLVAAYGERFFAQPGRIEKIATWTRTVEYGPATMQPNRLVLPLPHPLPDHDLRRAAFGQLHVQLAVPGEGVFETTQQDVLLRHRSPLRDGNLVETGSRFFAQESTHGSRMPGGLRYRDPSTIGPESRIFHARP